MNWTNPWQTLQEKWHELPANERERISSRQLLELSDADFLKYFDDCFEESATTIQGFACRGWYHSLYGDYVRGKKIIEIGPGIGMDGVAFAKRGADITFIDIVASNLEVVKRAFKLKNFPEPRTLHLTDVKDIDTLDTDYDAIFAFGSLHNAPIEVMRPEFHALARRLKTGGRFSMHTYPKQRWIDEGSMPFDLWGEKTDGAGTPWAEWYDSAKLISELRPFHFEEVFYTEYLHGQMNCIDLIKADGHPDLERDKLYCSTRKPMQTFSVSEFSSAPDWSPSKIRFVDGDAVISTAPACWSYAASLLLKFESAPTKKILLKIEASVLEGKLGFGVLDKEGSNFLAEDLLDPDQFRNAVFLKFVPNPDETILMVRNANPKNLPSTVKVHNIEVFEL